MSGTINGYKRIEQQPRRAEITQRSHKKDKIEKSPLRAIMYSVVRYGYEVQKHKAL